MPIDFEDIIRGLSADKRISMTHEELQKDSDAHLDTLLNSALEELDDELAAAALPGVIALTHQFVTNVRPSLSSVSVNTFMLMLWLAMLHESVRPLLKVADFDFDEDGNVLVGEPKTAGDTPRFISREITGAMVYKLLDRWVQIGGPFHFDPHTNEVCVGPDTDSVREREAHMEKIRQKDARKNR